MSLYTKPGGDKSILEFEKKYLKEADLQYENLVKDVKMQRHALRNQLGAILNSDSGDEKTRNYLKALKEENRHNDLILCGDEIIAGLFFQNAWRRRHRGCWWSITSIAGSIG